jgi:NSS family neurotransmitter:Na+ symporter
MAEDASREHWSGTLGFVLAAVGSAVGLGNVWKFPYMAGNNGGGAFVVVYLGCIAAIGLPMLVTEMVIGRRSEKGPVGAYRALAPEDRGGNAWVVWGFFAILTGFLLLSFYSVVGGWTIGYVVKAASGEFAATETGNIPGLFGDLSGSPMAATFYHFLFMAATTGVVYGGVTDGIERATKILMPVFGALLLGMFVYSLTLPGAGEGLSFLFAPDFGAIDATVVLDAMGQAFFTLSLGMGAMVVYGSYLNSDDSIIGSALYVAIFNTLVAITAGIVIFGVVFSKEGVEPGSGPSLVFETMPQLLSGLPGGYLLTIAFFVLLGFAALTSGISLLEVVVSYFVDELDISRQVVTVVVGFLIFLAGIPSVLSFSTLSDVTFAIGGQDRVIFGVLDYLISNWALSLGGLGAALYAGWAVDADAWFDELTGPDSGVEPDSEWYRLIVLGWIWIIRLVAPVAILAILYNSV